MLKQQYEQGQRDALAKFKLANLTQGAQAYNPVINPNSANSTNNTPTSPLSPPASPATPMAADVAKSKVLG